MLFQRPILPPTISDQIRLWELERDRFKFTDGVLYNQFNSQGDFELLRDYARVGLSPHVYRLNKLNVHFFNLQTFSFNETCI